MKLKDKVAVITGGSRGIGKVTAEMFKNEGAKVVIFDMAAPENPIENTEFCKVNVTDYSAVDQAVKEVVGKFGKLDVMVCNAGITRDSMVHKMTEDQFDAVISVNLKGAWNCARAAAETMREKESGKILFTSSVVGEFGNIGQSNYAASKAGLIGMAKSLAKELARKNVCVNVVAPGYTNTEMMSTVPEKVLSMIREKTPMGRLAETREIASAFSFLASDDASFITGQVLSVNGGLTL